MRHEKERLVNVKKSTTLKHVKKMQPPQVDILYTKIQFFL